MRGLLLKLGVFLAMVSATFVFPLYVLSVSGELSPLDTLEELSATRPVLVGLQYSNPDGLLKLRMAKRTRPEVLALGDSRVMQFRSDFFEGSFYNAAGGGLSFSGMREFFGLLGPDARPQLLILGMDQSYFNPENEKKAEDNPGRLREEPHLLRVARIVSDRWDNVYEDWLKGRFSVEELSARKEPVTRIGVTARTRRNGYRSDGSYAWRRVEGGEDEDIREIEQGVGIFRHSRSVSEKTLAEVDGFLAECRRRGIHVAGFMPPYSPRVYAALKERREDFAPVFRLGGRLEPLFRKHGHSFADFTDPSTLPVRDRVFIDGDHGSETAYRALWREWTRLDRRLEKWRPRRDSNTRPTV